MYADDPENLRRDRNLGQATMDVPAVAPAAGGGAPAGGAAPAPAPAHGTGFINLSQYLGANQGGAQGMANTIGGNVAQRGAQTMADATKYQGELAHSTAPKDLSGAPDAQVDPTLKAKLGTEATQATMGAQALQSPGGIGALLTQQYGTGGGYGSGMRGFDTFLTGSAGGNQFQQLGNQYGGLDKYVSGLGGGYTPQTAAPGGMHGGAAGKSPPGMVGGFQPPAAAPTGPVGHTPAGGAGPDERRKRRAF